MAKSSKTDSKSSNVAEFPTPETTETGDTAADIPEPAPQPAQQPPKGPGRPKKTDTPPESDFFQQVAAVRPNDWGTRVYLYLYQLEPVCDLKKSGGKAYLMRYEEPITDEHRIMVEQGSGRYRFILAKNKISPEASNELARHEFEIYNRLYPPKLPREAWVPDPRNRRWEVLLPKEAPPPPPATGAETVLDAIRLGNELRKEVRDELKPPGDDSTEKTQPTDPWTAAEKILNMRSDNPMVEFVKAQMTTMNASLEAERNRQFQAAESARQREHELQQKLLDAKTSAPQSKGLLEQATELAGIVEKLQPLKAIFGVGTTESGGPIIHGRKMTGLEFLSEVLPKVFDSPIANAAAAKIMQGTPNPAPNGTQGIAPQNGIDPFQRFIVDIVTPKMLLWFNADPTSEGGEAFADWIYAGFPEFMERLQKFRHPMIPNMEGAQAIVMAYKNTAAVWPQLAAREAQFTSFVAAFCAWKPPKDEPDDGIQDAEFEAVKDGPIDLDQEPVQ
jgi:hypothetical protein